MSSTQLAPGKYTALGYQAATRAISMGIGFAPGTDDYHQTWDRPTIVSMSRQLYRDNFLYESLIGRFLDMVMGPSGFKLQARTANPRLNAIIEKDLWTEFAKKPEVRELHSWTDLERLCLTEMCVGGDCGAIKLRGPGQLQMIEGEQIATQAASPRIHQGVELDNLGKPVAYHVQDYDDAGFLKSASAVFAARDFLYLPSPWKRLTSTRTMPALQSSFPQLHRIEDILNAEAVAWQLLSRYAIAISKRDAEGLANTFTKLDGEHTEESMNPADLDNRIHEVAAGTFFWGAPGETLTGIPQNRPPENFEQMILSFLRLLCAPLGIPLEVWLIRWGDMNLSSARAVLLQFYKSIAARWQQLLIENFHSRVYRWRVATWVGMGALPNRPDILEHAWTVPSYPWLDPKGEAEMWGLLLDRSMCTHASALASQDQDRAEVVDAREAEIRDAIARAKKIEVETGEKVPWQVFAGLGMGKTEAAARVNAPNAESPAPPVEREGRAPSRP